MANSVVQTIRDAEVDARSLSEFISKDATFTVTRRLAPTIHTLDYYLLVLNKVKDKGDLADIAISDTLDKLDQLEPTVIQRVEDAINNTAIEGGVLADTFLTVTSNSKISEPVNQRALTDAMLGNTYYAKLNGFKAEPGFDNSPAWDALSPKLSNGDIVIFEHGKFRFSKQMEVLKGVTIKGKSKNFSNGTIFDFYNQTNGVIRKYPYITLKDIAIIGTQVSTPLDPHNEVFGNVGLLDVTYTNPSNPSDTIVSGYNNLQDIIIREFDTGRLVMPTGDAIWAGAYRENYNVWMQANKIGAVHLDGATDEKYYGGIISANSEFGVISSAKSSYNNIKFIGTTIENNGSNESVNGRNIYDSCNIYSSGNSKVTLIGSYNEHVYNVARNGGVINKIGCHEHLNSYNYASDGTINLVSSSAAFDNKLRYTAPLSSMIYQRTGCTTTHLADSNAVRVSASTSGNTLIRLGDFKCRSVIKNKDIFRIKVSFDYDFKSGYTANPKLYVLPTLVVNSVTSGRTDSMNTAVTIPVTMLQNSYNQRHSFEFYYQPRTGETSYLDEDGLLKDMQLFLAFRTTAEGLPDFSTDNLVCDISNLAISILADEQLQFEYDHLRIGTTAQRPTLTSSEAGFIYRDTDVMRNVVWNGTRWDVLFDDASGVPFNRVTTTDLQTITSAINTTKKYASKLVYNNTTSKMYFATGSGPTSPWRATDGSEDITPA